MRSLVQQHTSLILHTKMFCRAHSDNSGSRLHVRILDLLLFVLTLSDCDLKIKASRLIASQLLNSPVIQTSC
jgi:hypothetical protein